MPSCCSLVIYGALGSELSHTACYFIHWIILLTRQHRAQHRLESVAYTHNIQSSAPGYCLQPKWFHLTLMSTVVNKSTTHRPTTFIQVIWNGNLLKRCVDWIRCSLVKLKPIKCKASFGEPAFWCTSLDFWTENILHVNTIWTRQYALHNLHIDDPEFCTHFWRTHRHFNRIWLCDWKPMNWLEYVID